MFTISHYEVIEKLGEGGMGIVWKARDTRLERFVALKVLPVSKTADPARRQRFVQEARAASALNHPRIITIHDINRSEGADGADFIVMEYVAGRTLDQVIGQGTGKGLRIHDALKYAIQIADALAAAHAAGIVHRDLKPANVMVTEKGDIKVLDFGLAKLIEDTPALSDDEGTRTFAAPQLRTEEGTILGTAAYMSPEQAEGKKVDARSDIFSFGSVLFEMLTGQRAFQGESKMVTLAAILNREPDALDKLNASVPRELVRVVQRCLRKDLDRRAHSMQDLKLSLEEIKEDSDSGLSAVQSGVAVKPSVKQGRSWPRLAAVAVVILVAGSAAVWFWPGKPKPEPILKVVPLTSFPGYETSPTFSPDGNQAAFVWNGEKGDNEDIYVQLIGSGRPLRLTTAPEQDRSPKWSPDGRSIAFVRFDSRPAGATLYTPPDDGSIMLIPALGGAEREVARSSPDGKRFRAVGGWSPDGRWLVVSQTGLSLLSVDTGELRPLTSTTGYGDYSGQISPDGRKLAFVRVQSLIGAGASIGDVFIMSLTPDLRPAGPATRLTSDNANIQGLAWDASGSEIVFSSEREGTSQLWRISGSGGQPPRRIPVGADAATLAVSPRANRLIYEQRIGLDTNVWRADLSAAATAPAAFISSTKQDESAVYSPDGKKIAFRSDRSGTLEIWTSDADGMNAAQITNRPGSGSPRWSFDGRQIAFDSQVDGRWQIFVSPAQGGQPRQMTTDGGTRPSWSHDGKWIYFVTGKAGRSEIFRMPSGGGRAVQLSRNGGTNPAESDDGASLYYLSQGGIAKSNTDGTGEIKVVENTSGNFVVPVRDGIYYQARSRELCFYNFSGKTSKVVLMPSGRTAFGLSVSSDGRWLLYSMASVLPGSDLMLVDNFR